MDPISAIFVMTVLTGLFVKGVDVATDGLLSAEVGAGIRGAGSYTARDVRDRWGRASAKARAVRSQTRQGRAVQAVLDDAAAVARTGWLIGRLLFGEARQFGSGIRSEWQTARDQARSVRTERRGDAPWPVTQWLQDGLVRLQESRTKTPNGEPNEANEAPNGGPERDSDDLGSPTAQCPDCGLPIVISTLDDHRRGRDRCPFADDPNGASSDPRPEPNTITPAEGKPWAHVRYDGCLHVTDWARDDEGLRWPRYCGEPREPGWVLCPTHLASKRTDPAYPQDEIDEYREDPDNLGPDGYRPNLTPNGDPNVPGDGIFTCHLAESPSMATTRCGAPWESWQTHRSQSAWTYPKPWRQIRYCPACREDIRDANQWPEPEPTWPIEGHGRCLGTVAGRVTIGVFTGWTTDERQAWEDRQIAAHVRCPNQATGPDGYCDEHRDPNGDPNVPLESTVPNANGDVRCGCCAQLHKPLAPGEHCPDCHIHDHPSQSPNAPTTKGPSVDINSAPAAIAAAETFRGSFETLQSRADALAAEWDTLKNDADTLHGEIATFMDGMGDFAIGGEADTAASVGELSDSATSAKEQADNVVASISTAKETVDAYIDNLHLEYDGPIEAAAGKVADVHSVMQEA